MIPAVAHQWACVAGGCALFGLFGLMMYWPDLKRWWKGRR